MWERLKKAEQQLELVKTRTLDLERQAFILPPQVNLLRNYHSNISSNDYLTGTVAGGGDAAAHWYGRDWSDVTLYDEHTTTTLSAAVLDAAGAGKHSWDKTGGVLKFGQDSTLTAPLKKLYGTPNENLFVRAVVAQSVGSTALASDIQLWCELWETTGGLARLCEGGYIGDNGTTVRGTTGAETREYEIEAITLFNDTFTSSVAAPITVTNARTLGTEGSGDYVEVSWQNFRDVLRYNIYRRIGGTVTLIGSVDNGGNVFLDRGGAGVVTAPASAIKPVVRAKIKEFKAGIDAVARGTYVTCDFTLYVPPSYLMPTGATDRQWIRIGLKKSDGTTPTTMADSRSILLDRCGVSYNYGDITPTPEDLTTTAQSVATAPPTTGGGSGGTPPPADGGIGGGGGGGSFGGGRSGGGDIILPNPN